MNKSIQKQYEAFEEGFWEVCTARSFAAFSYDEIAELVSGKQEFDWDSFKAAARYEGYEPNSLTIQHLWKVFDSFDDKRKKSFLGFVTSLMNVPVGGLGSVQITIQKTTSVDSVPTAHTCSYILHLPDYKDEEKMRRMLMICTENMEGFGAV